jgi:DNA-directed RNA polymerase subunit RPC12/RpoP
MTNVGNHIKCPQCGGKARVVWVSQNEKTMAIRCTGYHSHGEKSPSLKPTSRYKAQPKLKIRKGMIFLIETTKKE